jgi:diketogulonate reductase-like aldo/keto reductase
LETRRFGPLDQKLPVLGLGTWQMEADDRESAILAIRRAIDLGMSHVDTAEIYGKGTVEDLVGEALAGYRAGVFLTSKVHPDRATYAGTLRACEMSLRRLRTDHLDLYLLHWRGTQPLEETFRAFEALKRDGKIRAWGVSNFDVADLEQAIEIAGQGTIACNQVLYNLYERDAEHLLQIFCERHRIAFVGYSPLGSGQFPRRGTEKAETLGRIAARYGVTPYAVALAYLVRWPGSFTIPKSSVPSHVEDLAKAGSLVLDPADVALIEDAFPLAPPKSKLPYV